MSKHTKLPWETGPSQSGKISSIFSRGEGEVCSRPSGASKAAKNWLANAELIVLACNEHDDLVQQRKDLLAACEEIWLYEDDLFDEILEGDLGSIKTSGFCDALKQLKAAIDKATD